MDFQFDVTANGRRLKFLNVIDEYSRLCLAIRVGRRCKAKNVMAVLKELTSVYPTPALIRSDNGPEFIAQALRNWCEDSTITSTAYITPGSPWENGFAESINGRFRDEFLNIELFTTATEAQILADLWRCEYNSPKSHSALQGQKPWRQLNKELQHETKSNHSHIRPGLTKGATSDLERQPCCTVLHDEDVGYRMASCLIRMLEESQLSIKESGSCLCRVDHMPPTCKLYTVAYHLSYLT